MYINYQIETWTVIFQDTAQCCLPTLNSLREGDDTVASSSRDAGLLIAQFAISNALFDAFPAGELSKADEKLVKKLLVSTCCGLLDNRTNAYSQISAELAAFKYIDQIPLRLLRKILGIASGLPPKENDQFLSDFFKSLKSIRIPVEKILTATPPLPSQGSFGFNYPQSTQAKIRTRKSRPQGKQALHS